MDEHAPAQKGVTFLSQIRLGDIMTVVTIAIASVAWFFKTDARLQRVDEIIVEMKTDTRQVRQDMKEMQGELRAEVKEVRHAIERVATKIDRRGAP